MKYRSVAVVLLAIAVATGACAPPDAGSEPDDAPPTSPSPSTAGEQDGNPDDFGY